MKKKIIYFIAYYGERHLWWDDENERFVPAGLRLYRSTWTDLGEAMKACRKAKKIAHGWHDDIYIDSELTVEFD